MAEYEAIIYAKFLGFYAFFLTLFAAAVHAPVVEGGAAFIGMGLGLSLGDTHWISKML